MSFTNTDGAAEFPISKDKVFDAMCIAIPTISGMKISSSDKFMGRIVVKAGMTLFSWGEDIPIQLTSINENLTRIHITSAPITGFKLGGLDMGKNKNNIENILSATSKILQSNG